MSERPLGQLFSEVYRDRGDPVDDDPRFRVQVVALFEKVIGHKAHGDIASLLKGRLRMRPIRIVGITSIDGSRNARLMTYLISSP